MTLVGERGRIGREETSWYSRAVVGKRKRRKNGRPDDYSLLDRRDGISSPGRKEREERFYEGRGEIWDGLGLGELLWLKKEAFRFL